MSNQITAFILAGGKSTRMGSDKGLIQLYNKPLVMHVADTLSLVFEEMMIISNNRAYTQFGSKVISDEIPDIGPMGGITTGLKNSGTEWNMFISCDMPFMSPELLKLLANSNTSGKAAENHFDAVVPRHHHRLEPLCALYHRRSLAIFEQQIMKGNYKMHDAIALMNVNYFDIPERFFADRNPFENLNTPDDLKPFQQQ